MQRCAQCHRRLEGVAPCPGDGWAPAPPASRGAPPPPPRVPGFALGEPIGRGGFADVWAAQRDGDGAPAAIKVSRAATPVARERFRREADALERVGAPHVPRLHGRGELQDGRPYLAMERLVGETLAAQLLRLPAPPAPRHVARRATAIAAALEAAHGRGVVHRDLKPENIFFLEGAGERAALLDLGLSLAHLPPAELGEIGLQTPAGTVLGTPEYMAPEQIRADGAVGERADVYAFGVILFEWLTLRPPFVGDTGEIEHGHLALRPPRPGGLAPVPPALEELTLACLAKDPRERPAGAAAIRRALLNVWTDAPPVSEPRPSSRRATLIAEGRDPVALLAAEAAGGAAGVIAAITGRGGFVARQRGRRWLGVFSPRDVDQPAQAALAAAREIVDRHGGRAALHLASVLLGRGGGGSPPAVYGAAVDRPEGWAPREPWSGIALTEAFERALPEDDAVSTPAGSGAGEVEADAPLLGRGAALAALAASAAAAFGGACPGLVTVLGDAGLGKSRIAAEAARAAAALRPDALVLSARATHPILGGGASAIRALLRGALGASDAPPPDLEAFCEARIGRAAGAAGWQAVAAALGWAAAPAEPAPGSGRSALVLGLAEALRRRARRGPVAVILDDAHQADDVLLDAIEYATLDGAGVRLWAVVVAGPRFEEARRTFGQRSQQHERVALAPLDEAPAMELAARLLAPAEYPPAETLRRLAGWAGGNPGCLREIVRSLKRAGAVRRRAGGGHYVSTAEIDALPPSPAWQWLAVRQLDELPPELAACVRVCAVLGASFRLAELGSVLDAIDREGGAGTPIDAGFGQDALVARGILQRGEGDRCAFRQAVLQEAVYEMLDPDHRARIHRHALSYWRARCDAVRAEPDALEALARHAAVCGERAEAADAYLRLGDLASARHRPVEADQRYTAALAVAAAGDAVRRARALAGRGGSRYRVHRVPEARADFAAGLALAAELGDRHLQASLLLEDAIALDWVFDFEASARRVQEARPLIEAERSPGLDLRLRIAEGRSAWREGRLEEAIAHLGGCADRAAEAKDEEARVIALVMLSFGLACAGRLEEAEARFDELIARVAAAGDLFHLAAAYNNRIALWIGRWSLPGAVEDLRRAIDLAREIGNPWLEKMASHNVAVLLYWSDQQAEALALAQRARWLEERFHERPTHQTALLLAEILLSREDFEEAGRWVERARPPGGEDLACHTMVQLVLSEMGVRPTSPPGITWDDAARLVEGPQSPEAALTLLYWRARAALRNGRKDEAARTLTAARGRREGCPLWLSRFAALERELGD